MMSGTTGTRSSEDRTVAGDSGVTPGRSAGAGSALPGLDLVRRRLGWTLAASAVGLAAGSGVGFAVPVQFDSAALLSVTSEDAHAVGELTQAAQAVARVASSPGVVGAALSDVEQDSGTAPRLSLTVEASPNAPLISVVGHATDPDEARTIADAVVTALVDVEVVRGFQVVVVAEPMTPTDPTRPSWLLPLGGAALAGAVAAACTATVPERRRSS